MPEDLPLNPINPYGRSKLMSEWMIADAAAAHGFSYVVLRYFNVAGADPNGRSGQSTPNATHLIKVATQAALGQRPAARRLRNRLPDSGRLVPARLHPGLRPRRGAPGRPRPPARAAGESLTLNCGYGRGYSVLEVIEVVKRISGRDFAVRLCPRRPGDPARIVAEAGPDPRAPRLEAAPRRPRRDRRPRRSPGRTAWASATGSDRMLSRRASSPRRPVPRRRADPRGRGGRPDGAFRAFVEALRPEAAARGVSRPDLRRGVPRHRGPGCRHPRPDPRPERVRAAGLGLSRRRRLGRPDRPRAGPGARRSRSTLSAIEAPLRRAGRRASGPLGHRVRLRRQCGQRLRRSGRWRRWPRRDTGAPCSATSSSPRSRSSNAATSRRTG